MVINTWRIKANRLRPMLKSVKRQKDQQISSRSSKMSKKESTNEEDVDSENDMEGETNTGEKDNVDSHEINVLRKAPPDDMVFKSEYAI